MKKEILYIDDNSEILDFYKEALYDDIKVVVCTTEEDFEILFHLIKAADERPGKEISRLELTKLVWEFSWDTVTAHLLSTHIGSLRSKLNSQAVEVKTLRGRGMVLVISQ